MRIKEVADQMYPTKTFDDLEAEQLIKWSADDMPVEKSGMDYFGYVHYAKKIATRLHPCTQLSTYPSIGLRGGFGSGKSSVVNMTEQILEKVNPGEFIFCT